MELTNNKKNFFSFPITRKVTNCAVAFVAVAALGMPLRAPLTQKISICDKKSAEKFGSLEKSPYLCNAKRKGHHPRREQPTSSGY